MPQDRPQQRQPEARRKQKMFVKKANKSEYFRAKWHRFSVQAKPIGILHNCIIRLIIYSEQTRHLPPGPQQRQHQLLLHQSELQEKPSNQAYNNSS